MISIILYGRNDNYGYNLHKRAALSLNCMAEVLTAEGDEILFVDYNTPDDYPTFPEAIYDTLTERARRLLRVLRIRPATHEANFGKRTHLKALEPVSRNAAVRRSNPANRWLLSTNTDMIFVPRLGASLSDAVADLPKGFYCTPRFEIPETLWESFDRRDPAQVIATTRELGERIHLNEIVLGSDAILYDAPGDFQLIEREDLFALHGFHEGMLLGWHVDSNISKRLTLQYDKVGDASPFVFGYHCDHTRQTTPMHAPRSVENSFQVFVDEVEERDLPSQAETWGLAGVELEEIRLDETANEAYRKALYEVIETRLRETLVARYRTETYGRETAEAEHVLPFLLDLFSNARRDANVAWIGPRDRLFDLFQKSWERLGFRGRIEAWDGDAGKFAAVEAFIVNFGVPRLAEGEAIEHLLSGFALAVTNELDHISRGKASRRFIAVNAIHNEHEALFMGMVGCSRTPFATRLRHGHLFKDVFEPVQDWTSEMRVGAAGVAYGKRIRTADAKGHVFYGPYRMLLPGRYVAEVTFESEEPGTPRGSFNIEIVVGVRMLLFQQVRLERGRTTVAVPFEITPEDWRRHVEVCLFSDGGVDAFLERVVVKREQ